MEMNNVPVVFEKLNEFSNGDSRFIPVKIWLMHTGQNHNGSYFSKEVVADATNSLKNTPILGYVEENSDGEEDFSDHRTGLEKKDGKWTVKYKGSAYGIIPESSNPQFEKKVGTDGVEREYVTCQGLIWTKFDDAVDILDRDLEKSQSMEITDYRGYWDKEDGLYHFTSFRFNGACILGKDVSAGMESASIGVEFSKNQGLLEEINHKLEQFQQILESLQSNKNDKGGNDVEEKIKMLEQFSLSQEDAQAKGIDLEAISLEDLEAKLNEFSKADQEDAPEHEEEDAPNDDETPKPSDSFALTAGQLREEIGAELSKFTVATEYGEYPKYWLKDYMPEDGTLVAYDLDTWNIVGIKFSTEGDKVAIDFESAQRYKIQYVAMDINFDSEEKADMLPVEFFDAVVTAKNATIGEMQVNFEQEQTAKTTLETQVGELQTQVTELSEYKTNAEKAQKEEAERQETEAKDAVFSTFSAKLTEEEMSPVKEKASQMSVEDIETQLYAIVGKKSANFTSSKQPKERNTVKIPVDTELDGQPKYTKPWGHLIK